MKFYRMLEKMASFMVGAVFAVLTWDAALLAMVSGGGMRVAALVAFGAGLCLTLYWALVPRRLDRKLSQGMKKAVQRMGLPIKGTRTLSGSGKCSR